MKGNRSRKKVRTKGKYITENKNNSREKSRSHERRIINMKGKRSQMKKSSRESKTTHAKGIQLRGTQTRKTAHMEGKTAKT